MLKKYLQSLYWIVYPCGRHFLQFFVTKYFQVKIGIFILKQEQALGVNSGWIPLAGHVISGRFISFLDPQGLIYKMSTVHRVTFINNHTTDHSIKKSISGHESHEVSPQGYQVKPVSPCWFPGHTCPSSTIWPGERVGPWLLWLWFSRPTANTAPV